MAELTNEDVRKIIGIRLRALRLETQKTQRETAKLLGISRQALSGIECGKHLPNLILAHTICEHYRAPLDFLFTGRGLDRILKTKYGTMAQRSMPII